MKELSSLSNPLVQLPHGGYLVVRLYDIHPCDGLAYCAEAFVYGPAGKIGRCMD